jgi:hypothetical protein
MRAKAMYDVLLVSAFGRLEPLAIELAQRGMDVALLDVTKAFSALDWRDINGPFPMVTPNPAFPSHMDWLVARSSTELDRGFSLWLRSGPLELRGPMGTFYSDKHLEVGLLKDYLARRLQTSKPNSVFSKTFKHLNFQENWLIHLSHALTQPQMSLHCSSAQNGEAFPLNQSVQLLRLDQEGLKDLKGASINAGVDYFDHKEIKSIQDDGRDLDSIETDGGLKLRSHFFVWGLSQEESYSLNQALFPEIFDHSSPVLSDWVWRRLELSTTQELFKAMPESFLMIQNPDWSWTNENFVLFKKDREGEWDLWLRTPRDHFDGKALSENIKQELSLRLGSFEGEIKVPHMQRVFSYPVYEDKNPSQLPMTKHKNLLFEAKESDRRLDLASRFEKQVALLAELEARKMKMEKQNQKRGGVIDQKIHSP